MFSSTHFPPLGTLVPEVSEVHWRDGECILEQGEAADTLYVLTAGVVEVQHRLEDGRSVTVKLLLAPTSFGVIEAVSAEGGYLETVCAVGPVTALVLRAQYVPKLVRCHPTLAEFLFRDTCRAFCATARREVLKQFEPEAALAHLLLTYAELFGSATADGIRIELARKDHELAGKVGATTHKVQRMLRTWRRAGVVTRQQGRLVLCDAAALERIAEPLAGSLLHTSGLAAARTC